MTPNEYADFWFNEVGVNVIPAITKTKIPLVEWKEDSQGNWQTDSIPIKLFNAWKIDNKFDNGLAVICGQVHRGNAKGLWLNGIDCDNSKGIEELIGSATLKEIAEVTLVEQHANKNKVHFYYYTEEFVKSKVANDGKNNTVPQIEIKSGGKALLYCAGGHHKDGSLIEIVGTDKIKTISKQGLEDKIEGICNKYEIPYLNGIAETLKPIQDLIKENYEIHENENRSLAILRYLDSKKKNNPEFTEASLVGLGMQYNKKHCKPPYPESKIRALANQSLNFIGIEEGEKKKGEIDVYAVADQLMAEYTFMTLEGAKNKEILVYIDGIFKKYGEDIISKRSRKLAYGIKNNHISEIKGIVKDETGYHSREIFDKQSHVITLKNKTINLKTGEVQDHSPKLLSRVKIPVFYDSEATCPRFEKFLATSLVSFEEGEDGKQIEIVDEEKIRTCLEMIALCFIKDNSLLEKGFMHTGKGSNGKSILLGILCAMLGLENITAKSIHDFETDTHAASSLEGVLANICGDIGNKGLYETSLLKKAISGDPLDSNRKFFDSYPFLPYATLIFSANEIPEVEDKSDAFARRFELIEWEKQFFGKDRDHSVKNIKNTPSELSGIFNLILPIAKDLLEKHALKYESTVEDAKIKWLKKSDSVTRFIEELCSRGEDYFCPVAVLFGAYNKFAKENGMTPLNDRKFNAKLEKQTMQRGVKKIGGNSVKVWFGVTLASMLSGENASLFKGENNE